jgi:hypothetical protein
VRILGKSPLFAIEQIDLQRTSDFSTLHFQTQGFALLAISTNIDFPKIPSDTMMFIGHMRAGNPSPATEFPVNLLAARWIVGARP